MGFSLKEDFANIEGTEIGLWKTRSSHMATWDTIEILKKRLVENEGEEKKLKRPAKSSRPVKKMDNN